MLEKDAADLETFSMSRHGADWKEKGAYSQDLTQFIETCTEMARLTTNPELDAIIAAASQSDSFSICESGLSQLICDCLRTGEADDATLLTLQLITQAVRAYPDFGDLLLHTGILDLLEPIRASKFGYEELNRVYVELLQEADDAIFLQVMDKCLGDAIIVLVEESGGKEAMKVALDVIITVFEEVSERKLDIEFVHLQDLGIELVKRIPRYGTELGTKALKCLCALIRDAKNADVIDSYDVFWKMWEMSRTDIGFCREFCLMLSMIAVADNPERQATLNAFIDWDFLLSEEFLVALPWVWCVLLVQLSSFATEQVLDIMFSKNVMDLVSWVFDQTDFRNVICVSGLIKNILFHANKEQARCVLSHQVTQKMLLFMKEFDHDMTAYIIGAILRVLQSECHGEFVDRLRVQWIQAGVATILEEMCDSEIQNVAESAYLLYAFLVQEES